MSSVKTMLIQGYLSSNAQHENQQPAVTMLLFSVMHDHDSDVLFLVDQG